MSAAVLLVHSSGLSSRQWRKLAATLDLRGVETLSPDLLGQGSSPPWPEPKPLTYGDDLAHLMAALPNAPVHVVGHSYGAYLALKLALRVPSRVASLTLFDPVAFGALLPEKDAEAVAEMAAVAQRWAPLDAESFLEDFVNWWQGKGAWQSMREDARAEFRRVAWAMRQGVISLMTDVTPASAYAALPMPVQLITGSKSPAPAQRVNQRLSEVIPGARFDTVPDAGHLAPVTHSDAVNRIVLGALERAGVPTS